MWSVSRHFVVDCSLSPICDLSDKHRINLQTKKQVWLFIYLEIAYFPIKAFFYASIHHFPSELLFQSKSKSKIFVMVSIKFCSTFKMNENCCSQQTLCIQNSFEVEVHVPVSQGGSLARNISRFFFFFFSQKDTKLLFSLNLVKHRLQKEKTFVNHEWFVTINFAIMIPQLISLQCTLCWPLR